MQSQMSVTPKKVPVFVFPHSLTFYLGDQSTHKQILTLYNPYDFNIKFKVFCTSPHKYAVVDPEGIVKARSCVDIVVRHTSPTPINCTVDKFRIHMIEHHSKQILGKKDIEAKVIQGVAESSERSTPDPDLFQQLPSTGKNQQSYAFTAQNKSSSRDYIAVITIVVCLIGLFLPLQGEESNHILRHLSLTVNVKLSCSFALGVAITWMFLRLE